jgi:hypothetical protein
MSIPGFLSKTYEIFNTPEFDEVCGWGPKGETIVIKKIEDFSKKVLPKFFKHSNFQSFVRQLNMYDFHKTVQDPSNGEFSHQYFIKGRPDLLEKIKRKANYRETNRKNKIVYSRDKNSHGKFDPKSDVHHSDLISAESDQVLHELVQQRMIHEDLEKKMKSMEYKIERLEQENKVAQGENYMLKKMMQDTRTQQFVMHDKMERIMKALYNAYINGIGTEMPPGNRMLSDKASSLKSLTGMGSSFFDVCGFLQLESPMTRNGPYKPQYSLDTSQKLLISPPASASGTSVGEIYGFDNVASSVAPPIEFPQGSAAVPPLVELPPTPAIGSETDASNSKVTVQELPVPSSGREDEGRVSKKRPLTQMEAESLTLDTTPTQQSYEDFLKKARLQADSITAAARSTRAYNKPSDTSATTSDVDLGPPIDDVDPHAAFDILKNRQSATLDRIDSLESTLESFLEMPEDFLDNN